MRKTHKKILGFLSLGLVAAMTVFAATLPTPGAKATSTSITDTITVTVLGGIPTVTIEDPDDGAIYYTPTQAVNIDYQRTASIKIVGTYTDANNVTTSFDLGNFPTYEVADTLSTTINFNNYGYGKYVLTAIGVDGSGVDAVEDIVSFKYVPLTVDVPDPTPGNDEMPVVLHYDVDNVCAVDINVYLGNVLIAPPSPIHVDAPTTHITISLEQLQSGHYTIESIPYDCPDPSDPSDTPQPLEPYAQTDTFDYEKDEDIPVPDTGGLFMGLNVSKTDYLVTAIIVFFAFAFLALGIVIKGRKNNKRR